MGIISGILYICTNTSSKVGPEGSCELLAPSVKRPSAGRAYRTTSSSRRPFARPYLTGHPRSALCRHDSRIVVCSSAPLRTSSHRPHHTAHSPALAPRSQHQVHILRLTEHPPSTPAHSASLPLLRLPLHLLRHLHIDLEELGHAAVEADGLAFVQVGFAVGWRDAFFGAGVY